MCFVVINKYISPRVEATNTAWDGFALAIGGVVGITLITVACALLGLWLGGVLEIDSE